MGELTIRHIQGKGPDEHYIKDVRRIGKAELQKMVVYPEILKDDFGRILREISRKQSTWVGGFDGARSNGIKFTNADTKIWLQILPLF